MRGNLRTNAAGANLNREWQAPTMARSPEVFLVRQAMLAEGGDLFLDIHGDEVLPYNFVAGCEGIPTYSAHQQAMAEVFKTAYCQTSPDFQVVHGYPVAAPGEANMNIATHWLGEQFKTLAFTLEMPFKDNADLPNLESGWSPERSAQLGRDVLVPIAIALNV